MIDEMVLSELLRDEAEAVPVPRGGVTAIVEMLSEQTREQHRNRHHLAYIATLAAGVTAVAFALGPARETVFSARSSDSVSSGAAIPTDGGGDTEASVPARVHDLSSYERSDELSGANTPATAPASGSAGTTAADDPAATASAPARADQAKVIRSGSVALEVEQRRLGATVQRVSALAAAADGYVAKQESTEHGDAPNATLTIRVPSDAFATTVSRVRELGTVLSATSSGVDVSAQYTDLQARLRSFDSARTALLTVMGSTQNTGEVLAVLDRITQVQTQLEQVQGEIELFDDRAAFGALTVSIGEKPLAPLSKADAPKSGLEKAFDDAKGGFSRRVEWLVAHSGSGIVLLVSALVALLMLRLTWVRLRRGWL